ncbi:MAG: lactonase family protein [Clostridiales bacterium]|nr:lactonase family protein [Clostridiales bacterium]
MKNRLVFVGSYSQPLVLGSGETVPGNGEGVTVYRMDAAGHLARLSAAGKPNPTYLALSADQKFLYTVNELKEYHEEPSAAVSAYAVDPDSGKLTFLNRRMTGGADACCVSIGGDGRYLLAANFTGGSFSVLPILPDGSLATASCFIQHYGSGPNPTRQASPHVHQVMSDPAGRHVLVVDLGRDEIAVYGVDWSTGCVVPNAAPAIPSDPGDGPRQFVFDESGKFLYLVTELSNTVRVYAYDGDSGTAKFLQSLPTLPNDCVADTTSACIKLHPCGEFLYASNRGYDSIASYRVHQDGTLTPLSIMKTDGRTPRDFNITPDGGFLLCGLQDSNELILYGINPLNGQLTELERTPCNSPTAVLFADYE